MRKDEDTIRIKKVKNELNKNKLIMKKILLSIIILSFTACGSVKEKASNFKLLKTCPDQAERTLADMLCKEPK